MIFAVLFMSFVLGAALIGWAWSVFTPPTEFIDKESGAYAFGVVLFWPVFVPLWCLVMGLATFLGAVRLDGDGK
jgi:hypothetical protein